ncbi:hypothetical protein Ait01nite_031850 [Actinoplanes italicus]|uniref:Uncharacterized protein n=1 Tax=Actinoplanes italicus TaxID=113567 RepID=A0A2T0KJD0_9ACTN|nr:hypothetical protein [Actinoplanes italicus]PRX23640.1 hypothetical protein CLV67_103389 [Actinoplanes italicus]GIE30140.1 hypothetical protein Ait01nite_031850 [Actinoplanes italicus]
MFDFLKRLTRRPALPATDQPAGILRTDPASMVAQIDDHLAQVRSPEMRNWLLDERLRHCTDPADKPGAERPWCGAPSELGGQQPCPLAEPCDIYTCRVGRAVGNESYRKPGGEGGS